ncbi:MAG: hypothetical protein P4L26_06115 [Terracidiphilus sp.]|nr:hypothetical protein [Terracidiphilus sp.]
MMEQTSIAEKKETFETALTKIAAQDRRRHRTAQILTVVMVIVAAAWLIFSASKVEHSAKQLEGLDRQIEKDGKVLKALTPLLENFGWSSEKLSTVAGDDKARLDPNAIDRVLRSVEADDQLSKLRLSAHPPRAWDTEVLYYRKDIDSPKVASALEDFGFRFKEEAPLVADVPCNDIVFGANSSPEDARVVAYVLIRAGIDIKGIHRSNLASKSNAIQVIANRIVADRAPLSPNQVLALDRFDPDPTY